MTVVTGAAGFAGHHLVERLGAGQNIVGWRRPGKPFPETKDGPRWVGVDVTDRRAVHAAIAACRPSRVFHLAGAASVETSWTTAVPHLGINAMGTAHLLDALHEAGQPCRVVVVTSAQIYAQSDDVIAEDDRLVPQSPYGLTKLAQDLLASSATFSGVEVMTARPFNHIGPRQSAGFAIASFARQIARIERHLDPPVLHVGNLDTRRDITDVRDVVDAYVRIMDAGQPGRAYNVCTGQAWRIRDLLDQLLAMATVPIAVEIDPGKFRPIDVPIIAGNASRVRTELGWTPRYAVEQTLRDTLDYWRTQVAAG